MNTRISDPLLGCVLTGPTRWAGRWKLEYCAQDTFLNLQRIPGIWAFDGKNLEEAGWYVPQSLLDMGLFPGTLNGYEPEPNDVAPSGRKLRRYQARSVTFLRQITSQREGAMLVASPGLGKSSSALHALWLDGYLQRPGLVLGPNIAKGVWCDEDSDAWKHYGLRIAPLEGLKTIDTSILTRYQNVFCHFEILKVWQPWIYATLKPAWLIVDESHYLVNHSAQRSKAVRQLALTASIERRICLTGTAIPNSRMDLWGQLAVAQPRQWGSHPHVYGVYYCGGQRRAVEEGGNWEYLGETNTEELRARLAGTYLQYTTEEVGDELPALTRHVIEAEGIAQELLDDYALAQKDIMSYLQSKGAIPVDVKKIKVGTVEVTLTKEDHKPGAAQLVCLTTLIGILSKMKQAAAIAAIEKILLEHDRLVVFTWRQATAEWIHAKLCELRAAGKTIGNKYPLIYGPVHGDMEMDTRKTLAKEFGNVSTSIFVATMGSAGTAINSLSAASSVLLVDLHWNITSLRQAEKRVHRDGCKAKKVDAYYLVVRNTVDDLFIEKLQAKATRAAAINIADTSDLTLVRDLTPDSVSDELDLDLLCSRLMDMS